MSVSVYMFSPVLAGIYGAFLGSYLVRKDKTKGRTAAMWVTGILVLLLCIGAAVMHVRG